MSNGAPARTLEPAPSRGVRSAIPAPVESTPAPAPIAEVVRSPAGNIAALAPRPAARAAVAEPSTATATPPVSTEEAPTAAQQAGVGNAGLGALSARSEGAVRATTSGLARPAGPNEAVARAPLTALAAAPASASAQALAGAESASDSMLAAERARLAAQPPTMVPPTGLPAAAAALETDAEAADARLPSAGAPGEVPDAEPLPPEPAPPLAPATPPAAGMSDLGESLVAAASATADEGEGVAATIFAPVDVFTLFRQSGGSLEDIDTSAGERPTIALVDDLNPAEAEIAAAPRHASTLEAEAVAAAERAEDPGIDAIRPRPAPGAVFGVSGEVGALSLPEPLAPEAIDPVVAAGFDEAAFGPWSEATARATSEHDTAFAERSAGEDRAWTSADASIAAAQEQATGQQTAALAEARSQATQAGAAWSAELEAAHTTYESSRSTALSDLSRDVEARRIQGEQDAAAALNEGERQARDEQLRKQREVDAERARVERESESSDGFLGWLADKVESLFDALADFINDAFNWLRDRVRDLIDLAKRAARAAINLARDAINGMINLAAGALELAADVFLGAFPGARDRAKTWIRSARDTATAAVDSAADWLASQVDRLLDALGAALDFVLAAYQRAYLAILNAVRALVLGFIEIMRGIARLVDAARAMPDYFEGEVESELIGQDLTQPLFFERSEAAAGATALESGGGAALSDLTSEDLGLLGTEPLTDDQVAVDQVADFALEPALLESLALEDNGEVFFGGSDGPDTTVDAHLAGAIGVAPEGETAPEGAPTPQGPEFTGPELTPEQETEARLQELMNAEPDGACEASSAPTGAQTFPEEQKFGPLTRGQRARYLLSQMGKGIRQWFSCNWPWVLAATVAALVGIIALEIVTGGLITAALPILLEILAVVMIGAAVIRAGSHLGDYLSKAWGGDIQGGARSLAKGLAVGAVELIFAVLTYITAGAFRALAATARFAGRAVRAGARGVARVGRAGARLAGRGTHAAGRVGRRALRATRVGRAALTRGRLVFRGLRRGFARGARSLDELGERLGQYFRFRGFSISRRGFRILLWGHFNPRILLANGDIRTIRGRARRVGTRIRTAEGEAAVVIGRGRGSSGFVRSLERNARRTGGAAENRDFFRRLWNSADDVMRRRIIYNGRSTAALRRGIPGPVAPPLYQAHHIAPRELLSNPSTRSFFRRIGFNIEDGLRNGVMLPPTVASRSGPWRRAAVHFGSHPNYTGRMTTAIRDIEVRYARALRAAGGNQARTAAAAQRALNELHDLLAQTRSNLIKGLDVLD